MRRALAWSGGAIVLAAAAYLGFTRPVAPPAAPVPPAVAITPTAPVTAAPPAAKPIAVAMAPEPAPPPENPSTLAARAKAGEVAAMREFGLALLPCRKQTADAMFTKAAAGASPWQLAGGTAPACDALPADERERGLAWIERAAVDGDAAARRAYLQYALEDHFMPETVAADLDELVRRRDLARGFVREAMEHCEPDAFAIQRGAFTLLGMDDAVERIAVLQAERLGQPDKGAAGKGTEAAVEFALESRHVDAAAAAEAERRGTAMHARCAR